MTPSRIIFHNERVFRMGARMGCGFSYRKAQKAKGVWGASDILDRCYILVYIVQGQGIYEDVNGNRMEITPGVVYQRFPGVLHSNRFQADQDFAEAYLVLPPQICELMLATKAISMRHPGFHIGIRQSIYHRFEGVFQHLKDAPERNLNLALAEMHTFAAELVSHATRDDAENPFLVKASALLEADLGEPCSFPAIAKSLGMSYSYFRQHFQALTGTPPATYRLGKRMELAQQLLAEPSAQIKNVAVGVGYPDVYSFSKQFKRHVGLTPGQFAKSRRMGEPISGRE